MASRLATTTWALLWLIAAQPQRAEGQTTMAEGQATIESEAQCRARGGRWRADSDEIGCWIGGRRQGRFESLPGQPLRWVHIYRRGRLYGPARGYYPDCLPAYRGEHRDGLR